MKNLQKNRIKELGASLVEYGLLVTLIAVVALGAMRLFGENVSESFSTTSSTIDDAIN